MVLRPIMLILASFAAVILVHACLAPRYLITQNTLIVILLFLFAITSFALIKRLPYTRPLTYPCFFLLGALFILPNLDSNFAANHVSSLVDNKFGPMGGSFEGVLLKAPEASGGQTRFYIESKKFYPLKGAPEDISGRVRLTVPKKQLSGLFRGDTIRFLARLALPRNFNNPGGFDYEWWLARKGVFVTGRVSNADFIVKTADGRNGFLRRIEIIRERVNGFIDTRAPGKNGAIIKALVTGDKNSIDADTREAFTRTGTAHILAISGLHVGIVALFSYLVFFNILRFSERLSLALNIKKLSWALALVPIGFYGLLAGLPVSTQRAMIMVSTFVLAYVLDRSRDLYATLALAALIVLLLHPGSLWDVSFQFSFSAVFAIFYLVKRFDNIFPRDPAGGIAKEKNRALGWLIYRVRMLIFITAAASIATLPLSIYHFNNLPLLGMPLNLIAVPIVSLFIVPLSLVSILILPISDALATVLLSIDGVIIGTFVSLIKSVSNPGWSNLKVSTISLVEIASFYLIVFSLINIRKRRYLLYALPILLTGLTFPVVYNYYQRITNNDLRVTFLNVGQGEASFIEFPGGKTMLIDGGGSFQSGFDMGESVVSPFLRSRRIRKIDYLVLSHAQRDHKGGLPFIARSFEIGEFWWNGKGRIPALAHALEAERSPSFIMDSSTKPKNINGALLRVLNPPPEESANLGLNEASLVIKLTYKEVSLLFTGDIGLKAETFLKETTDLNADILKAPHHGSRYSSSTIFLEKVSPDAVVISAGLRNRYGFPHKQTLDRFLDIDALVFRTDRDGAVEAVIDGTEIKFKTYGQKIPAI